MRQLYAGRDGAQEAAARIVGHLQAQRATAPPAAAPSRSALAEPVASSATLKP